MLGNIADGKGTYIIGVATILFGVAGTIIGIHGPEVAVNYILAGFAILTGRRAIKKIEDKL